MTDQPTACRTTQHCATHDFCHRCAPSLHKATQHLVKAIDAAGIEYRASGRVYAQLATTVRDAARQTTGQDDTTPRCSTCGHPIEPYYGNDWIHTAGAATGCLRATAPAVGQPAEAHDTEARRPQNRWHIEGYDADEWNPCTGSHRNREDALKGRESLQHRYPSMPTRLVRETTTWTVEDES